MPLLEIIRTNTTPPQIVNDCLSLAKQIKKTPVVVGNCTGFAVNRVFGPYTQAAMMLADAGMDPYSIDKHGSPSAAPDPGTTLRRNVPPQGAGQLRGIPTTTPGSSLSPAAIPGCVPPPSLRPQVVYGFGMPMGPFRLADLVGGDVSLKTGTILSGAFPERSYRTALVQGLNDAGRKGEATKKGFYQYDARRKASPDPDLQTFLQASRQ
eukprot:736925-Prorocentrum_minimum.AAC.1